MDREDVKEYISSRLELSNQKKNIFSEEELNALYSSSKGNPRRLNSLITNCLIIGSQEEKEIIDDEIVMLAKNEIDFIEN